MCSHAFLRQFLSQLKLTNYAHKGNRFKDINNIKLSLGKLKFICLIPGLEGGVGGGGHSTFLELVII